MAILDTAEERDRLRSHDPELLIIRRTEIGGTVTSETYSINQDREHARLLEVAEGLDAVDPDDDLAARAGKSVAVQAVAEQVYGSRDPLYLKRVTAALSFDGPINPQLTNGAIVDVDRGNEIVFKTHVLDDFAHFAQLAGEQCQRSLAGGVKKGTARFNNLVALLERRKPEIREITERVRGDVYAQVSTQVPVLLRAIEPLGSTGTAVAKRR